MKWWFNRDKTNSLKKIDCLALEKEVYPDILINAAQIKYWENNYKVSGNGINHPYIEIAQMYTCAALHDKANQFYKRFLAIEPDKRIHGLYLQNLLLSDSSTNDMLLKEHRDWAKKYDTSNARVNWQKKFPKSPKTKLKIGYICHFFSNSISHNFLIPFLKLHDREKFEIYCYDDEGLGSEYHQYADHWCHIKMMDDRQLAAKIRADGIDIIQELNGFCIINRFGALAYRPAPIQINWYNHTATTGLEFIDYVMSDKISIPDEDLPYFVEKAYRTDKFIAAVHFDPEKFSTFTATPPSAANGQVTFGYFGGSHKITKTSIETWAQVLNAVPHSTFILKCGSFTHDVYRQIFLKHFKEKGIDTQRITFEGWTDQATTIKKYNEIDIMLDNIPVSGGSTLFEAVMQGVPTVTLEGNRWAARSGASVLKTLGFPELIAKTPTEYVEIAVSLVNNPGALADYRQKLRTAMQGSSLTSVQNCYFNFEKAYFEMWDNWCKS